MIVCETCGGEGYVRPARNPYWCGSCGGDGVQKCDNAMHWPALAVAKVEDEWKCADCIREIEASEVAA